MRVDSAESAYLFPHHITPTNLRPDVVWWSDEQKQIKLLELTVSHETVMDGVHQRKMAKYEDVVVGARVGELRCGVHSSGGGIKGAHC